MLDFFNAEELTEYVEKDEAQDGKYYLPCIIELRGLFFYCTVRLMNNIMWDDSLLIK